MYHQRLKGAENLDLRSIKDVRFGRFGLLFVSFVFEVSLLIFLTLSCQGSINSKIDDLDVQLRKFQSQYDLSYPFYNESHKQPRSLGTSCSSLTT